MNSTAERMLAVLKENGYNHFTGVPCSLLKGIFKLLESKANEVDEGIFYVPAVREDSALGVASGIYLGGKKSVVLMQNSGLGYSLNVLTSFNLIYDIPVLLLISWRGAYGNDAVEHDIIGAKLTNLLDSVEIPYQVFDHNRTEELILESISLMEKTSRPVALLIKDEI
ncbi:thiamine pyrophosphate-binding protein [Geobacillus stearothermophilus]|uniref:thiamine pyrophosphate-binding protein n=1 Tax=Geobacillus stearothermophilus TaxID=1422 RepID=UPI003D2639B5